jgi:cobalt-zinc-cadmium efflux system outer membrane protein
MNKGNLVMNGVHEVPPGFGLRQPSASFSGIFAIPKAAEGCRSLGRYRDDTYRCFVLAISFAGMLLVGCARFEPKPISPAQTAAELESRSLTNAALKIFLEENLQRELKDWPHPLWDFDMLTLAAFYSHPDLAVARAQWNTAQAGIKTAGGRPNPTLSLVPGYDTTHSGVPSPWFPAVSFDVPIETAGKRGKRIAAAENISESARLNVATIAWQIRSNLRKSLLDSTAAHQRVMLLQGQVSIQERIVELLGQQAEAGAIAKSELATRRIALQKARLDLADAASQMVEARARVAEAIGIPLNALDEAELAFDPLKDVSSPIDLTSAEVRRVALQSRSDILGALADYAAAQATLQLEVAKQYPDVHLNPGYQFDQGDNKWSLGITFDLPILNQNQGPIAEAAARREEAAAKFNALQAKVLAEIERAVEVFRVSEKNLATLQSLADAQTKQRESVEAQFKAGAMDRLDLLNAQMESVAAGLVQLVGQSKFQAAAGALEDAVQRPIDLMKPPVIESQHSQAMKENKP